MEIGQPNSAAMQATAPVGSPECTFFSPRSIFGRPESAVACMGALLRWPSGSACSTCCTGNADHHAPNAALPTQIGMLQLLLGDTDRSSPSVALATQIGMLKVLHWPHRSACPKCCTAHTDQHPRNTALTSHFNIFGMLRRLHKSTCST